MKKILISILIASLFVVSPVQAQLSKEQQKERSEQVKQQRKELDKKAAILSLSSFVYVSQISSLHIQRQITSAQVSTVC